jgi:hypothetical protein
MTSVRLAIDAYRRLRAGEPEVILRNRFFEANPTNLNEKVALVIRPALKYRTAVGNGPIRRVYYSSGTFANDAFVVSGTDLYRIKKNFDANANALPDTVTHIGGLIDDDGGLNKEPDVVARHDTGVGDYFFIADGHTLQYTNGVANLIAIPTPDGIGIASLDIINSYIICVQSGSQRCYWINPGELTIDPLNFFEAERAPDHLLQVRTATDQFWLLGQQTTEVWRMTGNAVAPFQRIEGRLFENGIWGGTAVKIKDDVVVVGNDGRVWRVSGGPQPVSNPGIAEMIRNAIKKQGLEL